MKMVSPRVVAGFLLKTAFVFGLVVASGFAGVGVAAFFAFHKSDGGFGGANVSRSIHTHSRVERLMVPQLVSLSDIDVWQGAAIMMDVNASLAANRFVAADSGDRPNFSFADNRKGAWKRARQTSAVNATTAIPAPLEPETVATEENAAPSDDRAPVRLTDPGSRYIMDERTGRIIGIDGSAGARAEARQQAAIEARRERQVRAALPALPVAAAVSSSDLPPPKPDLYPAVRRALPVVADEEEDVSAAPVPFNAASEVSDGARPVRRAEAVIVSPTVRTSSFGFPFR